MDHPRARTRQVSDDALRDPRRGNSSLACVVRRETCRAKSYEKRSFSIRSQLKRAPEPRCLHTLHTKGVHGLPSVGLAAAASWVWRRAREAKVSGSCLRSSTSRACAASSMLSAEPRARRAGPRSRARSFHPFECPPSGTCPSGYFPGTSKGRPTSGTSKGRPTSGTSKGRHEARPRCAGATERAPFPPAAPNRPRTLGKGSARGPSGLRRRRGGAVRKQACEIVRAGRLPSPQS